MPPPQQQPCVAGVRIDLANWETTPAPVADHLRRWAAKFFADHAWTENSELVGWMRQKQSVNAVQQLLAHNLKNWKCAKTKRYQRGWVAPISAKEFRALAKRYPKPVQETIDSGIQRLEARSRKRAREEVVYTRGAAFEGLRENVEPGRKAARLERESETLRAKIKLYQEYLDFFAERRAELPDAQLYIPMDWATRTPQEAFATRTKVGLKNWADKKDRRSAEKLEAADMAKLVQKLAEISAAEA